MSHRDPRGPVAPEPGGTRRGPGDRAGPTRDGGPPAPSRDTLDGAPSSRSTGSARLREEPAPPATEGERTGRMRTGGPGPAPPAAAGQRSESVAEAARRSGDDRPAAPPAAGSVDDPTDPSVWEAATADLDEEALETPATARRGTRPAPGRASARARARAREPVAVPSLRLPTFVAGSALAGDRIALGLLAVNAVSLAAMAAVLSSQLGTLPDSLAIHLDAAGAPDRWGVRRVLWRIPLLAAMTTAMNTVVAWALAPHDRFAGRFALAAALVVHLIAWVAVFDFI